MPGDQDTLHDILELLIEQDLQSLKDGTATPQDKERIRKLLADHGIQAGHRKSKIFNLASELKGSLPYQQRETA